MDHGSGRPCDSKIPLWSASNAVSAVLVKFRNSCDSPYG